MDQTAAIPTEETAVRSPHTLVPFDNREAVTLPTAAKIAGKSERTVRRTVAGSPAARAGLRGVDLGSGTLGDVIVGANGKPVRPMSDLTDQLEIGVDHTISLSIERGGRTTNIDVPIVDICQAQ
jgi:S1-C subfamily serine protease